MSSFEINDHFVRRIGLQPNMFGTQPIFAHSRCAHVMKRRFSKLQ